MNLPHHTAYDFMVYKDYKINLKLVFPICGINFRTQHLTCPLINHRITIYHSSYHKSLPYEFSCCIIHQPLIIRMLINDLRLSKFIQARHACRGIGTKNNLLIPFNDPLFSYRFNMVFSIFLQAQTGTFCSFNISFCNPRLVTKII